MMNLSTISVLLLSLTTVYAKLKFHESLTTEDLKHYFGTESFENVPEYEIVHPVHISGSRHRRSIDTPKPPLEYQIAALGEKYHLKLKHNDELIAPGCLVTIRGGEQKVVPCPLREHDCYYHGVSSNHGNSTVALSACGGLHGVISTPSHELVIQPISEQHQIEMKRPYPTPPHIAFRVTSRRKKRCALQSTADSLVKTATRRMRRQAGNRYIEMLMVADKSMYNYHKDDLTRYMLTAANVAAGRFLDDSLGVKIHLTITKIQILEDDDPGLTIVPDADETLTNFCKWQEKFNGDSDSDPNYVDAATLMTKTDLVHMGVRSTTGLATLGGICTKNTRCSVIEDDGLDLGLTLAHETGHSLNLHHDGEDNGCNDLTNLMSTGGGGGPRSFQWSSCSADYLKNFLSQGKGTCLNDEPQGRVRDFPKDLPGVIYSGEDQCRFFVGDGSSLCTGTSLVKQFGGDECAKLICFDPKNPGQCKGSQIPRMDGTECGQRKWCQQGRCVDIGPNGPQPQNGGWSEYSKEWTSCSRTCGGGIRYKSRKCNNPRPLFGGKDCEGSDVLAELCNLQVCPTSQLAFKREQCAATDSDPLYGQVLHWIPQDTSDKTQCQLYCRPEGQGTVRMRTLDGSQNFKDGTACQTDVGSYGRCVAGECRSFGCDGISDSGRTNDKCGVCSGNGNTCKKSQGKFNKGEGQKYVSFVKLSKGTTGIIFTNKNRYSVLSLSVGGTRILNKVNGQRDRSGTYTLKGVSVKYRPYPEKMEVIGTLAEDAEAQVYRVYGEGYQGAEPDIAYEYYTPKNNNAPKKFVWKTKDGACSVTCGTGTTQTDVICVKASNGAPVESYFCNLADKPSTVGKACTKPVCPANWDAGSFSECTKTCDGGTQTREVKCVRSGQTVADGQCTGSKPASRQECNTMECPGEWRSLQWTQCSKTCSRGVQTRTVKCYMNNKEVAITKCLPSKKPATTQSCLTSVCQTDISGEACADTADCKDYDTDVCGEYEEWAQKNCMAKCGYCQKSSSEICEDKSTDCKDYGKSACTEYKDWAEKNCASFCGFCKETGGQTATCQDKDEDTCREYGKDACTKWSDWAKENCPSMCSMCPSSAVTTVASSTASCQDVDTETCVGHGESVCKEYAEWSQQNCAKYCNLCGSSTGGTEGGATGQSVDNTCIDTSDQCSGYDDTMCEAYKEWATINCKKRCNFCEGKVTEHVVRSSAATSVLTTTASRVDSTCTNTAACASYDASVCTEYKEWAAINCKKLCGICGTTLATSPAVSTCKDIENCAAYGADVCSKYGEWANINCKKSCGLCQSGSLSTSTAESSTTTRPTTTTTTTTTTKTEKLTTTAVKTANTDCMDKSDCAAYGANVCTEYAEWAVTNCQKFCGHCSSTNKAQTTQAAVVTADVNCKNVRADCDGYGKSMCTQYADWAKQNCYKYCGFCGSEIKATKVTSTPKPSTTAITSTTATTSTTAITSTTTAKQTTTNLTPGCSDVRGDCEGYGKSACTQYADWAKINCKKFCGFCGKIEEISGLDTTKSSITEKTDESCTDTSGDCEGYGQSACTQYVDWAQINCKKFCGFCDQAVSTTPLQTTKKTTLRTTDSTCSDVRGDCEGYGKSACTQYADWAKINCKKFCGYCEHEATTKAVDVSCQDTINNCATYGEEACTKYADWAASNCKNFCNLCGAAGGENVIAVTTQRALETTAVVNTDTCEDTADCKAYGDTVCTQYGDWAKINCKKFCGTCADNSATQSECQDASADCAGYGANVCTEYGEWATQNCKKYCKLC